jgi:hypothetical protein
MSQAEARNALLMYAKYGFDILISGYIEADEGYLYGENTPIALTIGKSHFSM